MINQWLGKVRWIFGKVFENILVQLFYYKVMRALFTYQKHQRSILHSGLALYCPYS